MKVGWTVQNCISKHNTP